MPRLCKHPDDTRTARFPAAWSLARDLGRTLLLAAAALLSAVAAGQGDEYYVDPQHREEVADGSSDKPWKSLQSVIERRVLKGGDTVYLRSGNHGGLWINGLRNQETVTIIADNGQLPRFTSIRISASANWHLRGLAVSPSFARSGSPTAIVTIDRNAEAVVIEDFTVMSAPDSTSWSAADWNAKASNGIVARGTGISLRDNLIKNVNHGIVMHASHSTVENNLVENFSGDGIRGLGNHTVFKSNTVKNCYSVNDNHDDGFQSWSVGADGRPGTGEVIGVVLSGNQIINYEDPDQPLRCTLQGIGLYGGTYVDWVIENNVVIVDHWHGITVMGARNMRVINNTVIDPNKSKPGPPWITITRHRNGAPPKDSFMVNNLASSFNLDGFDKGRFPTGPTGVTMHNNLIVNDPAAFFQNPGNGDLRLAPGSPATDAGTTDMAPATDIDGKPRPAGKGVDVGAHEFQ